MSNDRKRLVILISGRGSNMLSLLRACDDGLIPADVVAVISNKASAAGLTTAEQAGIATAVVDHKDYPDRETFDRALYEQVSRFTPDFVILAGFMRILTAAFVRPLRGRLINIHPSLLPNYPGLNTHARALEAGDGEAGASVHFVTEELDGGPPILHARVSVREGDTPDSLAARVLEREHHLYPEAVRLLCEGRVELRGNAACLDGEKLPPDGLPLRNQNQL